MERNLSVDFATKLSEVREYSQYMNNEESANKLVRQLPMSNQKKIFIFIRIYTIHLKAKDIDEDVVYH